MVQQRDRATVIYPDCDGQPMSDNTLQFQWIVIIKENLEICFADRADVFVAGDLLWYPVQGNNKTRLAPDVMVALSRPKGYRGSYRQWEEAGVAPQVVFEILSPGNRFGEMLRKFQFYEQYGVEEYYVYDPERLVIEGWLRNQGRLEAIASMLDWVSPRLQVRFGWDEVGLVLFYPDGHRFMSSVELAQEAEMAKAALEIAKKEAQQERDRADRLAARLRELGVELD